LIQGLVCVCASGLVELVEDLGDVRALVLLDKLPVLVIIGVAELHELNHDRAMGLLHLLLVELLRVGDLRLRLGKRVALRRRLHRLLRGLESVRRTLGGGLRSRGDNSDALTTSGAIGALQLLLDVNQVVELALGLELVDDGVVLVIVIIAEVFHHEEDLSELAVRRVGDVACGRERRLKLLVVGLWL